MYQLALEALVVGVITAVVVKLFEPTSVPGLVLMGALIHVGFELSGANAWYCKHGYACTA